MVFRLLKNFCKLTVLISLGAIIGVWFAPPGSRVLLKQKLGIVQKHTGSLQSNADNLWSNSLQPKLSNVTKSLDPRRIDKKTVDGWLQSGKNAVATLSAEAKRTKETLVKANQVIQSAKSEYRKAGTILGM